MKKVWVSNAGVVSLVSEAEASAYPEGAQWMPEDQSAPWAPVSSLAKPSVPVAPSMPAAPAAPTVHNVAVTSSVTAVDSRRVLCADIHYATLDSVAKAEVDELAGLVQRAQDAGTTISADVLERVVAVAEQYEGTMCS